MSHILLIDDDELLRDTVLQMLELDGHRVTEANSGEAALKLLGNGSSFDLVLTDILMPGIDGTRVILEVHKRRPGLPVVAMSGGRRMLSPQFNLQSASVVGARAQLSKPFNRQELQSALSQALNAEVSR